MATELLLSHHLFATYSPWAMFAILFVGVNAFVLIGRKLTEGQAYNVSYSSVIGGAALIGCMAIAGEILHRPDLALPVWLVSSKFHLVLAAISLTLGVFMGCLAIYQTTVVSMGKSQFVDLVFNFAIAPLFFYLLGSLIPVVWFQGTSLEWIWTVVLIVGYLVTACMDIMTGRLNQPEWREVNPGHNFLW